MRLNSAHQDMATPEHQSHTLVRDLIIEIVAENGGIRETDLTIILINSLSGTSLAAKFSTEALLNIIQMVIDEGRVVAVDCQFGDTGSTFLFPTGTQIRTVVPIDRRPVRH